ncbi:head GIN domain-containing protein [Elizabethkingia meningoseptica]|uniref:head GIN domain-containing protein n=1 Tax=Elizabethkingia meningoseptica TaxID=238 RepID=UPI003891D6A9
MKNIIAGTIAILAFQFSFSQTVKDVGTFSSLKVYDKIPVVLVPSSSNKVEIDGKKSSDVEVVNKNGELKVRMTTTNLLQGDDVKVKVFYDRLNDIQASQGAMISGEGVLNGNKVALTANEGSTINIGLKAKTLEVKTNTGGQITLSGHSNNQTAIINTGSKYYAKKLETSTTSVTVNAGGEAEVYATELVDAKTRAGGNITVYGNPADKKTKKFAGGNIWFK